MEGVESMLAFSVPGEWSVHYSPKVSTSPPTVPFLIRRVANGIMGQPNVNIVFNTLSMVTSDAQEASDVLNVVRLRPMEHHTGLIFLSVEAVLVKVKATKVDFLTCQGTFGTFGLETMFCHEGKHISDMHDVFCHCPAVNHHIVLVCDDEYVLHWLYDAVHHAHQLAGCVCQAKRQDLPLV